MAKYITIGDLEVYRVASQISKIGWEIYKDLDYHTKKIIGDQFITSLDSIGANISEGYGRFHYSDKIKFNYNSRGSLFECCHWIELMLLRKIGNKSKLCELQALLDKENIKLNNFISSTYKAKTR